VIACPAPGDCTAGGTIFYPDAGDQAFVATERHGTWGDAQLIKTPPGIAVETSALSCTSAGNCVTAGWAYPPDGIGFSAFAATQTRASWGKAVILPGTAKLGSGIDQLACPAPGDCAAFGSFETGQQARLFVSTEKNGIWHDPQTIAGYGDDGVSVEFSQMACPSPGNCIVTGSIAVKSLTPAQAAVATQVNGRWGPATLLPGILAADKDQSSGLQAVSCPARSRCTAVGIYGYPAGHLFASTQR
jgi:hypothetical protein